jgi:tetratricopeptide (TPR) repeat protein
MPFTDCYGLPITTSSHEALECYNRGVRGLLGFHKDTAECFERALALDPNFNMARSHLGMAYFLDETAEQVAKAKECFTQSGTAMGHLTDRERDVLEIVLVWAQGKAREALERMHAALAARPGEVTLLQKLYFAYFMQGMADKMRDTVASVVSHYPDDSYVLGMYGFSLEETRDFARAFEFSNKARALNPTDAWSLHALAHCHYETGAFAGGVQLLNEALPQCGHVGFFRTHLTWHHALFLWEQGKSQQALEIYHQLFPDNSVMLPPNFADAVTLLWRLNLTGVSTPDEWQALTPSLDQLRTLPTYLFNQMHVALGLTGARRTEWATAYLDGLRSRVRPDRPGVVGEVAVPAVEGLLAYSKEDYRRAVDCLWPIRDRIVGIGGSHAQREVFVDILADACLRSSAYKEAVELLEAKRQNRPDRPLALAALEKAYQGTSETGKATDACTSAQRLWQTMGADK